MLAFIANISVTYRAKTLAVLALHIGITFYFILDVHIGIHFLRLFGLTEYPIQCTRLIITYSSNNLITPFQLGQLWHG